ncbi:hypothetical protein Q8A73_007804 [Channa argus]|nr:hypothetical protein Q8A73_007804 [Channa argus]
MYDLITPVLAYKADVVQSSCDNTKLIRPWPTSVMRSRVTAASYPVLLHHQARQVCLPCTKHHWWMLTEYYGLSPVDLSSPGDHVTTPTTPPFLDTPGAFSNGPTSFSLLPRRPRSKV